MRLEVFVLAVLVSAPLWGQAREGQAERRKPAVSTEPTAGADTAAALSAKTPTVAESDFPAFSEYRLGPDDLISITVMDSPEFSRQVRVSGAGTIKLPLVQRAIPAAGKTSAEMEQQIALALVQDGLLREPAVSVTVREFHSKPVSISGCVRAPMVFQATRPLTLVEAISRAGGLTEMAGPEMLISVPESEGRPAAVLRVSTKTLTEVSEHQTDTWLRGGEDVRVPPAGRVYVLGGVGKPGFVLVNNEEPLTLLRALALSGGTTPAAGTKAYLLRPTAGGSQKQEFTVNLKKLLKRREPDLPLQVNDMIFVPDSKTKALQQGAITAAFTSFAYTAAGALLWR